jgi:hypothetical protein
MSKMEMHQLLQEMDRVMGTPLAERAMDEAGTAKALKAGVDRTRKFVRSIDNVLAAAADMAPYTNVTSDVPSERNLGKELDKYKRAVNSIYGQFIEGRSAMYLIFKGIGSGTDWKWAGKGVRRSGDKVKPRTKSKDVTGFTDKQLVSSVAGILEWITKDVRSAAEVGSTFLKKADECLKKMQQGTDDPMEMDELLNLYLDFRDKVNVLFASSAALYKRGREAEKRVLKRLGMGESRELDEAADKLDFEDDPEIKELM